MAEGPFSDVPDGERARRIARGRGVLDGSLRSTSGSGSRDRRQSLRSRIEAPTGCCARRAAAPGAVSRHRRRGVLVKAPRAPIAFDLPTSVRATVAGAAAAGIGGDAVIAEHAGAAQA